MTRLLLAILAFMMLSSSVAAERLVSGMSTNSVEITSSFDGETLTFFGSVGDAPSHVSSASMDVVIAVIGPTQTLTTREMTRNFGIWINTDEVNFSDFPSYIQVLSSQPLADIADIDTLIANQIVPEAHVMQPNGAGMIKTISFGRELIRLMSEAGIAGTNEAGVRFLGSHLYTAQLTLPSNATPGPYIARTLVFSDGELIARKSERFSVRKIGLEGFVAFSAIQYPALYGLVCVVLALFTGWLGGALFRH